MPVAYFSEGTHLTSAMRDRVSKHMHEQLGDQRPRGAIYHAEGELEGGGIWAFDVWESEEDADRFYNEVMAPAAAREKVVPSQRRRLPVAWEVSALSEGQPGS